MSKIETRLAQTAGTERNVDTDDVQLLCPTVCLVLGHPLSLIESRLSCRYFTDLNQILEHRCKVAPLVIWNAKEVVRLEILGESRPKIDQLSLKWYCKPLDSPDVALDVLRIRCHVEVLFEKSQDDGMLYRLQNSETVD